MPIDRISQDLLVVTFADRHRLNNELKAVNDVLRRGADCHVLLNLQGVELLNSSDLSNLIILRRFLHKIGRKIVLYNVSLPVRCIFVVTGLRQIFQFAQNREEAIVELTLDEPVEKSPLHL